MPKLFNIAEEKICMVCFSKPVKSSQCGTCSSRCCGDHVIEHVLGHHAKQLPLNPWSFVRGVA